MSIKQPEVVEMPSWALAGNAALVPSVEGPIMQDIVCQERPISQVKRTRWCGCPIEVASEGMVECPSNPGTFHAWPGNKSAFSCSSCPQPLNDGYREVFPKRCQSCNIRYKRWQRVKRASSWLMQAVTEWDEQSKFLTLTETLRTKPTPFTEEEIENDRHRMKEMFRRTRNTQAWPAKYRGIWVYEAKVRSPGDVILSRWPNPDTGERDVIRTATEFELHGHIHAAVVCKFLDREPLLERHEGVHIKVASVDHMKDYLMGYMFSDTVGRYARIQSKMDQPFDLGE